LSISEKWDCCKAATAKFLKKIMVEIKKPPTEIDRRLRMIKTPFFVLLNVENTD
jgi:hypothetical protein